MLRHLQKNQELLESCNKVPQGKVAEEVVEKVNDKICRGQQEFYLPHKTVIRGNAESTKPRIVYDASARKNSKSLSLKDCLGTSSALQNLLWSILTRTRFKPIALCSDLQKAFFQM